MTEVFMLEHRLRALFKSKSKTLGLELTLLVIVCEPLNYLFLGIYNNHNHHNHNLLDFLFYSKSVALHKLI